MAEVAAALKELKEDMVFVGGAVISLYTDDPAADEIRPTQDVDLTTSIIKLSHWEKLQRKLSELGFHADPDGHSICSYKYKNIPVDIMSTDDGPFGPANKWYKLGLDNLWIVKANNEEIRILSAPCFLATKFEAFNDRGSDYRTSHDIEDVIYVIDNRVDIVAELANCKPEIRAFVKEQLQNIVSKGLLKEVLVSHIHPLVVEGRLPVVEEKIMQILSD